MLHIVDEADHSFHVPKKTGRADEDVLAELAAQIGAWVAACGRDAAKLSTK